MVNGSRSNGRDHRAHGRPEVVPLAARPNTGYVTKQSVEEEVNRRLAERELTLQGQQSDMGQQKLLNGRNGHTLLLTSE